MASKRPHLPLPLPLLRLQRRVVELQQRMMELQGRVIMKGRRKLASPTCSGASFVGLPTRFVVGGLGGLAKCTHL
jgi:hypothetical protein